MTILLLVAFGAGVLTILSPCILPVVPLVLATAAGGGRTRPLGVVLGLAASFTLFSVVLAAALAALGLTTATLRLLAVAVLAGAGLALLVPPLGAAVERRLAPLARLGSRASAPASARDGFAGGLLLGGALGLIWAPCAGPIMAGVLALAVTSGPSAGTAAVALAYALGAGVPLLAIGYGGRALARRTGARLRGTGVRRAFGGLMVLTCLAILFNVDIQAQTAVAGLLPEDWSTRLVAVENAPVVQQELGNLKHEDQPVVIAAVPPTPAANPTAVAPPAATSTPPPVLTMAPTAAPAPPATPAPAEAGLPRPVADQLPASVKLDTLGPAPEITGITDWINTAPLTLRDLRGKVVLVHFWTFACINCIHVQPYVKAWYERYKAAGFVVLGIHTPELSFEREIGNVRDAVQQAGVTFPVAFDPQYATWNAYRNGYWPAFYYVDKTGQIRYTHIGEGNYADQEQVIRQLLREPAN